MRSTRILAVVVGAVLLAVGARAATVALNPSQDTTLYEDSTKANSLGTRLFVGHTGEQFNSSRRALLQFDLSSVPAGATITSAELVLYCDKSPMTPVNLNIGLHLVNASWGIGTSVAPFNTGTSEEGKGTTATTNDTTWTRRFYDTVSWASAGGDYAATPSSTASVPHWSGTGFNQSWSGSGLTTAVQNWLTNSVPNYGLIMVSQSTQDVRRFHSKQGTNKPVLLLDFSTSAPTPSPVASPTQEPTPSPTPAPTPVPSGVCCIRDSAPCATMVQSACATAGGWYLGNGTTCTVQNLCPFIDPMPRLSTAQPYQGAAGGYAYYEIKMQQVKLNLHSHLANTTLWGYNGLVPGPTIEAFSNQRVYVRWINDLRYSNGSLRTTHVLNVDECVHGPSYWRGNVRTVVHAHGVKAPPKYDGYPDYDYTPGNYADYIYDNDQRSATLWYHDHALGITRLNAYMGLAGMYIIRDAEEQAIALPTGEFDVPLFITDRQFVDMGGQLYFPSDWVTHHFGKQLLVNGKVWPYMKVARGKYRFRVLNACGSRTLTLYLSNGASFQQIGSDGGLISSPVTLTNITMGSAERAELVIDFSSYAAGTEITLMNSATAPFPLTFTGDNIPNVMRFVVESRTGYTAAIPSTLRNIPSIPESLSVRSRNFTLWANAGTNACKDRGWTIDLKGWDEVTDFPVQNSTEIWTWVLGPSEPAHPMHVHGVFFQVLDRYPISYNDATGAYSINGSRMLPEPYESGWKDVVMALPGTLVRTIHRFPMVTGRYPFHCHMLSHEDHDMMRQYQLVYPTSSCNNNGICEANEDCTSCPADCPTLSGARCGNGLCETGLGDGENCINCPQDCAGTATGTFCCGNSTVGAGSNPVGCSDSRCSSGSYYCRKKSTLTACCGDDICFGAENATNCPIDCDTTFPGLASNVFAWSNNAFNPNYAIVGSTIDVTFKANETLNRFKLGFSIQGVSRSFTVSGTNQPNYTANLAVNKFIPEGPVRVVLTNFEDLGGNSIGTVAVNTTVIVDRTPPNVTGLSLYSSNTFGPRNLARSGQMVFVNANFSEPLGTAPTIWVGGVAASVVQLSALQYTASLTLTSQVDATVSVSGFRDIAGIEGSTTNVTTDGSTVTIDNTRPSFTVASFAGNNAFSASYAIPGTVVVLNLTASEAVTISSVTFSGVAATVVDHGALKYSAFLVVPSGSSMDGKVFAPSQNVLVSYVDRVGNDGTAPAIAGGNVTVDTTPPSLSVHISSNNVRPNYARLGQLITLTFNATEPLATLPTVTLAGQSASVVALSTTRYSATVTVSGSTPSSVAFSISGYQDRAGLLGSGVTTTTDGSSVTVDLVLPSVSSASISSSNPFGSKQFARTGQQVIVLFTLTEVSYTTPTVTIGGSSAAVVLVAAPSSYRATLVLGSETTAAFSISGYTDIAGNSGLPRTTTTDATSVTIDNTPPTLANVTIANSNSVPLYVRSGSTLTLNCTASEVPLSFNVSIGGIAATATLVNGATRAFGARVVTTATSPTNGLNIPVVLTFRDQVGNTGTAPSITGLPLISATAPLTATSSVRSSGPRPWLAKVGDNVVLTVATSRAIQTPTAPQLTGLTLVTSVSTPANVTVPQTWTLTYAVPNAAPNGLVSVPALSIVGIAGTPLSVGVTDGSSVTIDVAVPTLSNVAAYSPTGTGLTVLAGGTVIVAFQASENITGVNITIGGVTASVTGSGRMWQGSVTVSTGTDGAVIPFAITGYSDLAGNVGAEVNKTSIGLGVTFATQTSTGGGVSLPAIDLTIDNQDLPPTQAGQQTLIDQLKSNLLAALPDLNGDGSRLQITLRQGSVVATVVILPPRADATNTVSSLELVRSLAAQIDDSTSALRTQSLTQNVNPTLSSVTSSPVNVEQCSDGSWATAGTCPTPPSSSSGLGGGAIAGIVIGILAVAAIAGGIVWYYKTQRDPKAKTSDDSMESGGYAQPPSPGIEMDARRPAPTPAETNTQPAPSSAPPLPAENTTQPTAPASSSQPFINQ